MTLLHFCIFFSSMHSRVNFYCITEMVLRCKSMFFSTSFSFSSLFSPTFNTIKYLLFHEILPTFGFKNMDLTVSSPTFLMFFLSVRSSRAICIDLIICALHEISSVAPHYSHNKLHSLLQSSYNLNLDNLFSSHTRRPPQYHIHLYFQALDYTVALCLVSHFST